MYMELVKKKKQNFGGRWLFDQEISSQVTVENSQDNEFKQKEDCEHSFIYRDDTGEVCCVCGLIKRHIASMIEFVFNKSGDSSESDVSPRGYNGNGTRMYGVSEEEEEAQLWREMAFAQESFQIDDCVHSFIFKDDIGEVCCVCGLIKRHIARMIEFEFNKDDMLLL